MRGTVEQRFDAKYVPEPMSGCWLWTAAASSGYGSFAITRSHIVRASRFAYERWNGPIPDGQHVLHACDVKLCVNPAHLHLGTHDDNMREKSERYRHKTVCQNGHVMDDANTYVNPSGWHVCRACARAKVARFRAKHAVAVLS